MGFNSVMVSATSLCDNPFRTNEIQFTFIGILDTSPGTSSHNIQFVDDDYLENGKASSSLDATSSCRSSSTTSSSCTPNSITTELTNVADPEELEVHEKEVQKVITRENIKVEFRSSIAETSRKRLLSDRGEHELKFPVCDQRTSKSGWSGCNYVKNRCGAGLHNFSNDCFLNVVLQAVVHTPQLSRFLIEKHDEIICKNKQLNYNCISCGLRRHIIRAIGDTKSFEACWIQKFLLKIFPSHRRGLQEDAHEMLTLLLSALEPPVPKQNGTIRIQPIGSSPIEQIFGGSLRNQIRCNTCGSVHTNYERIREINLGLNRTSRTRISELLNDFFNQEQLHQFFCKSCKAKRTATRFTKILRCPNVLIVQLKRFNLFGGKNRLPVKADATVNLGKYVFNEEPAGYILNGVIEHLGSGVNFGHYICAWRGFNEQTWFKFDDSDISQLSPSEVDAMQPYILFYTKIATEITKKSFPAFKRRFSGNSLSTDQQGTPKFAKSSNVLSKSFFY